MVLGAGAVWLLFLTPASGGFHDPSTAVTALALLPALLAVRPWRWISGWLLLLVGLAAPGALAVLFRTPTGWEQADSPAGQVLGLMTFVASSGRWRWLAGLLACVSVASVALTTSRTCLGLQVIGVLGMAPLVLGSRHRGRSFVAWVSVPAGEVLLLLVLTSSLFFARPWSGLSAVRTTANNPGALGNRGTSSLATNGDDRGRWTAAALTT